MVTRSGEQVPPLTDESLEASLWRVRQGIDRAVGQNGTSEERGRPRRSRRRVWFALAGAVLLFGAGLSVGAWALPALAGSAPAFKVVCYESQAPDSPSFVVSFDEESRATAARQNPASICATTTQDTARESSIDEVVQKLIHDGHSCGVVNTTDGSAWSFTDTDGSLSMTTGTFVKPLGSECIVVNNVTLPTAEVPSAVACVVSDAQTNVYPGDPKKAAHICAAKG